MVKKPFKKEIKMQKLTWQNANGDSVNLTSFPYGITNWEGFSGVDLNIQSQQVPMQDGAVFLDALLEPRVLTVTLAINDNNNLENRYKYRRELIHILNPKLGEGYLIYKNDFTEKRIKCIAQVPVFQNKNSDEAGTPKASLSWTACEPYWEDLQETQINLKNNEIVNIQNNGDIKTQILINVINQGQEQVSIQNIITNEKIKVNSDEDLIINTNFGEKSVKKSSLNLINTTFDINSSASNSEVTIYGGSKLCYSYDNIELNIVFDFKVENNCYVFYSELLNKFIIITRYTLYTSDSGYSDFVREFYNENYSSWSFRNLFVENSNCVIANLYSGANNKYYKRTPDSDTWTEISFPNSTTTRKFIEKKDDTFIVVENYNNKSYIYTTDDFETFTLKKTLNYETLASCTYTLQITQYLVLATANGIYQIETVQFLQSQLITSNTGSYLYYSQKSGLFILNDVPNLVLVKIPSMQEITLIDETVAMRNIVDFKNNVYIATNLGTFLLKDDDTLEQIFSRTNYLTAVSDLVLWQNSYYSFDGKLWLDKDLSSSNIKSVVFYNNKLYGVDDNKIKVSLDGFNFTTIKEESFTIKKIISTPKYLVRIYGEYAGKSTDGINWTDSLVNSNYSVQDICYVEDWDIYVAVGYGPGWYSTDLEHWTASNLSVWNWFRVVYDKTRNCLWTTGYNSGVKQGIFSVSYDGITWERFSFIPEPQNANDIAVSDDGVVVYAQINGVQVMYTPNSSIHITVDSSVFVPSDFFRNWARIFYSKIFKCFFLWLGNYKIWKSYDGEHWDFVMYTNDVNFDSESELHKILYSTKFLAKLETEENLISQLTEDSNMNLGLNLGDNYILPNFNGDLIFRQKYLGV